MLRHIRLTYNLMLRVFLFAALSCWVCCQPSAGREPEAAQTIQELEIGIQNKAPSTYFALATELFRSGRKDDAAFWYYVGQLRYRFFVLCSGRFLRLSCSILQALPFHPDRLRPLDLPVFTKARMSWVPFFFTLCRYS